VKKTGSARMVTLQDYKPAICGRPLYGRIRAGKREVPAQNFYGEQTVVQASRSGWGAGVTGGRLNLLGLGILTQKGPLPRLPLARYQIIDDVRRGISNYRVGKSEHTKGIEHDASEIRRDQGLIGRRNREKIGCWRLI